METSIHHCHHRHRRRACCSFYEKFGFYLHGKHMRALNPNEFIWKPQNAVILIVPLSAARAHDDDDASYNTLT